MDNIEKIRLFDDIAFVEDKCPDRVALWESIEKDICEDSLKEANRIYLSRAFWVRFAAVAVIVVGIIISFSHFNNKVTNKSGDLLSVVLPCDSKVQLDPNASISYNTFRWSKGRKIDLDGAATIKVTKGSSFRVHTHSGDVKVLGTEFYVKNNGDSLWIDCISGVVQAQTTVGDTILKGGDSFLFDGKNIVFTSGQDESSQLHYDNVALGIICKKIEQLYDVKFINIDSYITHTYTGILPNDNLDLSLTLVMGSCGIKYTKNGSQIELK